MDRYSYICKISTNWINVEDEFEIPWMTKKAFDSKSWEDHMMLQHDVVQTIGLGYEIVDDGRGFDEPALLRTNLQFAGCETEEEVSDTFSEAQSIDYEEDAIIQQGIRWNVIEIDNLKIERKEKLTKIRQR